MQQNQLKKTKLRTWSPSVSAGETIIMLAARRSGKSILCKFLLNMKNGIIDTHDIIIVFGTGANRDQYKFIDDKHFFIGYDPEIINKIMKGQEKIKKDIEKKYYFRKSPKLPKVCIILDDVISFKTRYDNALERVFFTGRHYNITLIYITQSFSTVAPAFLRNVDKFIFWKFHLKNDKKKLYEILGACCSEDEAAAVISYDIPYRLYVFDMLKQQEGLKSKLYKYKVPEKFIKL